MKDFAIIRHEKIKGEDHFNGLAAHNRREYFSKNIDRSRTDKNITLTPFAYKNFQDFVEAKRKMIREMNKRNGTKNRMLRKLKNKKTGEKEYPSMAQEFIFTYSPGALTEEQGIRYLKLADKFLREWFADFEVIASIIHLDETTPHLHFDLSYFDMVQGKFRQAELQAEGKTDINAIRQAWDEYLQDTEFEHLHPQDGSVVGERHLSKASLEIASLKNELQAVKSDLDRSEVDLSEKTAQIANLEQEIATKEETISDLLAKLEEANNQIDELLKQTESILDEPTHPDDYQIDGYRYSDFSFQGNAVYYDGELLEADDPKFEIFEQLEDYKINYERNKAKERHNGRQAKAPKITR